MERTASVFPTIQRVRRIVWNWWRTNWVLSGLFPRIYIEWDAQTNPERSERLTNKSRSTTFIGQRMKILLHVSRMPEKYVITQRSFSEDIGHSLVREMKKNGMERAITSQKGNGTKQANQMIECRTEWSSRVPRCKCAQPWDLEAKIRTK